MNKTTKTGDTEKKEVILTETVSSVFFVVDNYNFKTVYTNGTKVCELSEKNCEKYLYSFL